MNKAAIATRLDAIAKSLTSQEAHDTAHSERLWALVMNYAEVAFARRHGSRTQFSRTPVTIDLTGESIMFCIASLPSFCETAEPPADILAYVRKRLADIDTPTQKAFEKLIDVMLVLRAEAHALWREGR